MQSGFVFHTFNFNNCGFNVVSSAGKTQLSSKRLTKKQPLGNAERSIYKNSHLEAVPLLLGGEKKYIIRLLTSCSTLCSGKTQKKYLCCLSTEKKKHFIVSQWGKKYLPLRDLPIPLLALQSQMGLPHDL